jgi:hypothetical protein
VEDKAVNDEKQAKQVPAKKPSKSEKKPDPGPEPTDPKDP